MKADDKAKELEGAAERLAPMGDPETLPEPEPTKRPVGRPLKFETVEDLEAKADAYFAEVPMPRWTITGLAVFLDTSRETLTNYIGRPEFFDTVKKAKDKVEWAYEESLRLRGNAGDIFGLKNMGWSDKQEFEQRHTSPDGSMTPVGIADKSTVDELVDLLKNKTADQA